MQEKTKELFLDVRMKYFLAFMALLGTALYILASIASGVIVITYFSLAIVLFILCNLVIIGYIKKIALLKLISTIGMGATVSAILITIAVDDILYCINGMSPVTLIITVVVAICALLALIALAFYIICLIKKNDIIVKSFQVSCFFTMTACVMAMLVSIVNTIYAAGFVVAIYTTLGMYMLLVSAICLLAIANTEDICQIK